MQMLTEIGAQYIFFSLNFDATGFGRESQIHYLTVKNK